MCSEPSPKEFHKVTEVLPFSKYGLSSLKQFQKAEDDIQRHEWLRKAGLTNNEIKLYQENEAGQLDTHKNIEDGALKEKLDEIYKKINQLKKADESSTQNGELSQTDQSEKLQNTMQSLKSYPEGHPMHNIKQLEENLLGHLKQGNLSITKRRKILRHLERRKNRILTQNKEPVPKCVKHGPVKPGSLWDVEELPPNIIKHNHKNDEPSTSHGKKNIIGPKKQINYTIKDKKIVRLEPVNDEENGDEYRAVDIVMPVNAAEEQLLEGTKMCLDDIKKIEQFKNYEPGVPSKVLYLKNIAPTVTHEQLSLLFNQFLLDNGGPIDVRLMSGRMRGQAFVAFRDENVAVQALEETNGTILSGRPVIAQFGRNTNRINDDEIR